MRKDIKIWDRNFKLDVIYDCYEGEEVLSIQEEAINKFEISDKEMEHSLNTVKLYVLKENMSQIHNSTIDNIFKYVMPNKLYVVRNKKDREVAILCNYKFDMEQGMAVVFKNEKFYKVGPEDIVL